MVFEWFSIYFGSSIFLSNIYLQKLFEKFMKTNILSSKLFLFSDFPFFFIYDNFFKNLWKQKYCILNYFNTQIVLFMYIYLIFLKNLWKLKYCIWNYFITQIFHFTYICKFFRKNLWKTKYCIWDYFVIQIFLFIYINQKFFENFLKKNVVVKYFLSNFQSLLCVGFFLLIYIYKNLLKNLWKQKYFI